MRWLVVFLFCALPGLEAAEYLIVSGGPALRYFERHKTNTHDRYWGNFIDSAALRIQQIRNSGRPENETFTWLVFRPGYEARGREDRTDYPTLILQRARTLGVQLVWFESRQGLVNYMNSGQDRKHTPISGWEYFGHSNRRNMMFDYSSGVDGGSLEQGSLHMNQLKEIRTGIFAPGAHTQSWGCHSGEEFCGVWFRRFNVPMKGAIGKTDYSRGGIPYISTPGGRWNIP
jgi:hypothetical protein